MGLIYKTAHVSDVNCKIGAREPALLSSQIKVYVFPQFTPMSNVTLEQLTHFGRILLANTRYTTQSQKKGVQAQC